MNLYYKNIVKLLLDTLPFVFSDGTFVLKGGTAINLFYRNLPRLSVDIDLAYAERKHDRETALGNISENKIRKSACCEFAYRCRGNSEAMTFSASSFSLIALRVRAFLS